MLTGSGFVRVSLPYSTPLLTNNFNIQELNSLPLPSPGSIAVIQRDATGFSLDQLQSWYANWMINAGKLIYEIDDDLLDRDALLIRHFSGDLDETISKVEFLARCANVIHVSTPFLAERLFSYNKNIRIIPNFLDSKIWRIHESNGVKNSSIDFSERRVVRICYIGTPTHDDDLNIIKAAMQAIEVKYGGQIEIDVIGGFQKTPATFGKRVALPKQCDYPSFVNWLICQKSWDIGIIPLASNNFNKSKSYLKFLEYAALGLSIVLSEGITYSPVAKNGVNSLVVSNSTQEWVNALSTLIENSNFRVELARQAKIELLQYHLLNNSNNLIFDSIVSLFEKGEYNVI